jgi:hypothetical protein
MKTNDGSETNSSINSKEDEVQTAALQDVFTKKFIHSSEEVEKGYHQFTSATNGYKMLFPINAMIDDIFYEKNNQGYEAVYFGEDREEDNIGYSVKSIYENEKSTEWTDSYLQLLIGSSNLQPEDFEQYTLDGKLIYFAEEEFKINDKANGTAYIFLSFIKSQTTNQAVSVEYTASCTNETLECNFDVKEERQKAKKLIHSISFIK